MHCGIGLRLCSRVQRSEWEMSTVGSHILTLGPKLVLLFGEIEGPSGGRTLLEEYVMGKGLRIHPSPWFQFALCVCGWKGDLLTSCYSCLLPRFPHYYGLFSETVAANKFFLLSFAIKSGVLSQRQKSNTASIWKWLDLN